MAAGGNREIEPVGGRQRDPCHRRRWSRADAKIQVGVMIRFLTTLACAGLLLAQRAPVEEAWDLLAKGERKQAIRVLHEIIKANPRDADARLVLGSVLMEDGERAESIAQPPEAGGLLPRPAQA